ncbi:hypothetical protein [Mucilaginibacter arboris]|uniref:MalT-like TPR region domain-containing protein n=1 Tax=Mucilaginibacter arboris TaxID=2682090 RepID=A0A7K1SVP7_9SPHI|nr:hypothetical protein [Mucilaginibacter arboris]MVN21363.1 hypothetical protein [Mucilaginibacter arboris]
MKLFLAVFISLFSLKVSAQWPANLPWHKNHERLPQLIKPLLPVETVPETFSSNASFNGFNTQLARSRYRINAEEAFIMKNLRRSMRYGSDSMRVQFNKLANFYFSQNRFSEAKWYVLRSNAIARQQKNYEGIIGSLLVLADVKSNLGDFKQANADLFEAKTIAASHSMAPDLLLIEQHSKQIRINKEVGIKAENHYSDLL